MPLPNPIPGLPGADQYAEFVLETTWGTYNSAATARFWMEIENGAFKPVRKPLVKKTKAATSNITTKQTAKRYEMTSNFKIKAYPDVMKYIVPWAFTPAVSGLRKILPSFSVNYFDGVVARRLVGGRFEEASIVSTTEQDWVYFEGKIRFRGEDPVVPTMTEPTASQYPQIDPWHHTDSAGFVKLNPAGTAIAGYDNLMVKVANALDPRHDEQPVLSSLDYNGRTVTSEADLKTLDNSVRLLYENQSASVGYYKWSYTTGGGSPITYTMIFDLQAAAYPEGYDPNNDLAKTQYQKFTLEALIDPATGLDCVATVSP